MDERINVRMDGWITHSVHRFLWLVPPHVGGSFYLSRWPLMTCAWLRVGSGWDVTMSW